MSGGGVKQQGTKQDGAKPGDATPVAMKNDGAILLETRGMSKTFGGLKAVDNVTLC